jgi:hypothetical protein
MDKLTNVVRKARRVGVLNKIEGIETIRTAYPEPGQLEAKQFFDLITGEWSHVAAVNMHALWCPEHWEDRLNCGCSLGESRVQATAPSATTTSGQLMTAEDMIKKIDAEKTAKNATPGKPELVPGIFPNEETRDYWMAEFKRDPSNWHRRLLAAAGVTE